MDPLSIIASTLGTLGAIVQAGEAIKKISGLPDAFKEVQTQLPVVEQTLRDAKSRLRRGPDPTEEEDKALASIIKNCENKASKLKEIFCELEKKCKGDAEGASWAKARSVYRTVLAGQKAHRVETLMQEILKSIKTLALREIFQAVTKNDLEEIEKAIVGLSQTSPSLDDSEVEAGGVSGVLNVASGGKAQQNNVQGDGNTFNEGENVATGTGHTIYFGPVSVYTISPRSIAPPNQLEGQEDNSNGPEYSILPPILVSHFVGRTTLLEGIRQAFDQSQQGMKAANPAVTVLTGIGGQGKSQTALRFCHLARGYFAKFWINATSRDTTKRSFERIAAELSRRDGRRPRAHGLGMTGRMINWEMVVEELASCEERWLLVFDNYDDPGHFSPPGTSEDEPFSHLIDFFPPSNRGSILITSRDRRVGSGYSQWNKFDVPALDESDALSLLLQFSQDDDPVGGELEAGKEIVRMLSYLPLAISQTAWFISKYAKGFQDYLLHFDTFKKSTIKKMPESLLWKYRRDDNAENWFTTYEHSLATLADDVKESATSLLTLAVHFGDAAIHEDFFQYYCQERECVGDEDPKWLSLFGVSKNWDLLEYRGCIAELANRSLVEFQEIEEVGLEGFQFSIHPVIREWLIYRTDSCHSDSVSHTQQFDSLAVDVLAAFIRTGNIFSMSLHKRMDVLAHINRFLDKGVPRLYQGYGLEESDSTTPPALSFAIFCREFSRMEIAKVLLEMLRKTRKAAGISEMNAGSAEIQIELGQTFFDNAEYSVAESHFNEALRSPHVVDGLTKCRALLGQVGAIMAQGRIRVAIPLAKGALHLAESLGNEGRRMVIRAKLYIANADGHLGNIGAATKLSAEAFELSREYFGETDNLTLEAYFLTWSGPAVSGKPDVAIAIILDALQKIERYNGLEHWMALNALLALGTIYGRQRSYTRARECFEQCKFRAHVLWGNSPGTLDVELLIGHTYVADERFDDAKDIFERILSRSRGKQGFEMVFVRATQSLLQLHLRQGQFRKTIPYLGHFLRHFPFFPFFKIYRTYLLLILGTFILIFDSVVRGNISLVILICGAMAGVSRFL